jgi:tRNA nucleotidyltransferase/poly(A) polymerase
MQIFSVGGSVRDALMGLVPHDHDYLVVGSTPAEMEAQGFTQVGKDFPVYLHPVTGEEYALARVERKAGLKHTDFETLFDSSVTIEEDLRRRDLTINAIAIPHSFEGEPVDPYGGLDDIKNKVLRHVSEAFSEDPLRVLRLARFTCKFPDFTVSPETAELCRKMAYAGELDHLTRERVFEETKKAFISKNSSRYLSSLLEFGASMVLWEDISVNDSEYLESFDLVEEFGDDFTEEELVMIKFAVMFFPSHQSKVESEDGMKRLKLPVDYAQFASDCIMFAELEQALFDMDAECVMKLMSKFNIDSRLMKNPNWLNLLYFTYNIITRKDNGLPTHLIREFMEHFRTFNDDVKAMDKETMTGKEIGEKVSEIKRKKINEFLHIIKTFFHGSDYD